MNRVFDYVRRSWGICRNWRERWRRSQRPKKRWRQRSNPVVTAGFQNSHVHLVGPGWQSIGTQPAVQLRLQTEAMLTRYGVTTAVDIASSLPNASALRERIENGEVPGPRVLTAGTPLYPKDGVPYYAKNLNIPPAVLRALPQPKTTAEAVAAAQQNIAGGADVIKLFTG